MIWIIVVALVAVAFIKIFLLFFTKQSVDAYQAHKEKKQNNIVIELNTDTEKTKQLWETRIRELNINLDRCIKVLYYYDTTLLSGHYMYMWNDDNKIYLFNSVDTFGQASIQSNPTEWKIHNIPIAEIDDIYKRQDYCQLAFKGDNMFFDNKDYDKIKNLLEKAKR